MKVERLLFIFMFSLFTQGMLINEANAQIKPTIKPPPVAVVFETTMGSFTLELDPAKAPQTVANFLTYVDVGFYNDTLFHRVIPGFVIQGGGFEKGMNRKVTNHPIENESNNGLMNIRSAISMARMNDPDSATSQFFINVSDNKSLDVRGEEPGYTVFGKVTAGMDIIDKIVKVATITAGRYADVPKEDIVVLTARRSQLTVAQGDEIMGAAREDQQEQYIPGEHYVVLDQPVATRDSAKIEVVEAFAYGCPHCYDIESVLALWQQQQVDDVDFWNFPAVWNEPMKLYARAFYTAQELNVTRKIHLPLFTAIVVRQQKLSNEGELADFFAGHGVDKKTFSEVFNSSTVETQVEQAAERVRSYRLGSVPQIVVNGKYRIDAARAGGRSQMLAVVDFLVKKERAMLDK